MALPAEPPVRTKTAYVILSRDESGYWTLTSGALVEAHNASEAIRQVAKAAGRYVAIPERSWKPADVAIETQTVVKLGEAK